MDSSTTGATTPSSPAASPVAEALARALGVSGETAEILASAGYSVPEAARELSMEALHRLGVSPSDADRIRAGASGHRAEGAPAGSEPAVERWAGSVRRADKGRRRRVAASAKDSSDVLRKWVDGDDRAMEDWIRSSEPARPAATLPLAPATGPAPSEEGGARSLVPDAAIAPVLEREETVVRWLTGLLDRVKSDQFDPSSMIQEVQELHRQLFDERTKRKQLEDEVEHVKRGSIAVIKYVRSREAKEREIAVREKEDEIAELKLRLLALESVSGRADAGTAPAAPTPGAPATGSVQSTADAVEKATRELDARLREEFSDREHEYIERETELRRRIVQLEGDVRNLRSETDRAREREQLLANERGPIAPEVKERLDEVAQRERDLVTRENELRTRFEEIRINAEEIERRRAPLEFKERELAVYDQQLETRKKALDLEARRLEELRRTVQASGSVVASDESRRLDDLRHQLSMKEAELKGRETLLHERMGELERMGAQAAEAEAGRIQADIAQSTEDAKLKSGVRRLDDLLFGGFSPGLQILVNGPAHTGKDVLARLFSVEGLRSGVPSIWVVTDKTYLQVREDLAGLHPGFAEAEKRGMIRYVDLYSRAVGSTGSAAGVRLLSSTDKGVLDQLAQTVNGFAEELLEQFKSYRLIFESVSTITAYLDTAATFRFLQPFIGRRKLDRAVAYYVLDSGMHAEADLETLEHMVDGSINLKIEQLKTFLSVKGLGEAQARAWIGYTFSKRSLNLGSFSLEHIR
ncbi:MAG TPA: ATPase domain-containing protein [Thermoplasmata archaeon]|nr:ATPase domain-containing protein [Thermoplasmata archaeon]